MSLSATAASLKSVAKYCKLLTKLVLNGCDRVDEAALRSVQNMRKIKSLELRKCRKLTDEAVYYVPNWNLQKIDLSSNSQLGDGAMVNLAAVGFYFYNRGKENGTIHVL